MMPEYHPDDMIGRVVLGRYQIVRLLARGGMGSIYLARNKGAAGFVRPAVVKKILPSYLGDSSAVSMFAREARIMANLRHPGIVNIIDFAEESGAYVMVLEYVHGTHTGRWLRFVRKLGSNFPVEIAVQVMVHVLDALSYAHTATSLDGSPLRIVHRDIKPSNILVDVSGHVKLADFGIARAHKDHTEVSSGTTKLKGTFPYLAPEIFDNVEPSPQTDVYACGVVLHNLLSGRNEFAAKEVSTTIMRVLDHIPTPLDRVRTDISPSLARVVARALAKNPEERYRSATLLATALRDVRELEEASANELLRNEAARNFRDPQFAKLLKIDDLGTLEKSLTGDDEDEVTFTTSHHIELALGASPDVSDITDPSIAGMLPASDATIPSVESQFKVIGKGKGKFSEFEEPTRAERPKRLTETDSGLLTKTRSPWPLVLAILLGCGIIGGAILLASGAFTLGDNFNQTAPPIDVYSAFDAAIPPADAGHSEPVDAAAPDTPPPPPPPTTSGSDPCASMTMQKKATIINKAIRRGSSDFGACINKHPTDISSGTVKLKVSASATGKVTSASVAEGVASSSGLGRCLVSAAQRLKIDRLCTPQTFQIPITTKR